MDNRSANLGSTFMTSRDQLQNQLQKVLPFLTGSAAAIVCIIVDYYWPRLCDVDESILYDLFRTWKLSCPWEPDLGWYRNGFTYKCTQEPHVDGVPISAFRSDKVKEVIASVWAELKQQYPSKVKYQIDQGKHFSHWETFGRYVLKRLRTVFAPYLEARVLPDTQSLTIQQHHNVSGMFQPVGCHDNGPLRPRSWFSYGPIRYKKLSDTGEGETPYDKELAKLAHELEDEAEPSFQIGGHDLERQQNLWIQANAQDVLPVVRQTCCITVHCRRGRSYFTLEDLLYAVSTLPHGREIGFALMDTPKIVAIEADGLTPVFLVQYEP